MKNIKNVFIAFCLVLGVASAAFCIDPFKITQGGFGPRVKGLQLGQDMILLDMIIWRVKSLASVVEWSFPLLINHDRSLNTQDKMIISFSGYGADWERLDYDITEAVGSFARCKEIYEDVSLDELLMTVEQSGMKTACVDDIIFLNKDHRVYMLMFPDQVFGAENLTDTEFIREIINAYGIPRMNKIDNFTWSYRELSQGWEVIAGRPFLGAPFFLILKPIITNSTFD